jgi:small subunit ribosomal protein S3
LGQKTHPVGFRLGGVHPWQARWFADKAAGYRTLAVEDQDIRKLIADRYEETGGITRVEIERGTQDLVVSVHTARPGIVIGRGGQRVDELRTELESLTGKRARLNIQEVRNADVDAYLVGRNIADQLERRVAYRRAMRLSAQRTMQAGAQGVKIIASGRLGGAEIARKEKVIEGRVPLHTLRANIDFAIAEAATTFGRIGIKVWIYKGDILPEGRAGRTLNVADVVAEQESVSAAALADSVEAEAPAGSVAVVIPAAVADTDAIVEEPEV